MVMKDSINVAVAGATGYVGLELINILNNHPQSKIKFLCAQKSIGKSISSFDILWNICLQYYYVRGVITTLVLIFIIKDVF